MTKIRPKFWLKIPIYVIFIKNAIFQLIRKTRTIFMFIMCLQNWRTEVKTWRNNHFYHFWRILDPNFCFISPNMEFLKQNFNSNLISKIETILIITLPKKLYKNYPKCVQKLYKALNLYIFCSYAKIVKIKILYDNKCTENLNWIQTYIQKFTNCTKLVQSSG